MGNEKTSKETKQIQPQAKDLGAQIANFQAAQTKATDLTAEIARLNAELQRAAASGDSASVNSLSLKLQAAMQKQQQLYSLLSNIMRTQQEQTRGIIANLR